MRLSGSCTVVTEFMVIVPVSPSSSAIVPVAFGDFGESVKVMLVTAPVPPKTTVNVPEGGLGEPEAKAEAGSVLKFDPSVVVMTVKQPVVGAELDVI
jgi:hypothetical protein